MSINKKIGGSAGMIGRTYFGKLYHRDKLLFAAIALFFTFSILANLAKLGITPFFLWDIYSEKIPPQPDYSFYEVRYNDNKLVNIEHSWEQCRHMLLFDPLSWYADTRIKKSADPFGDYIKNDWGPRHPAWRSLIPYVYDSTTQFEAFPGWYKRYLSSQVDEPIRKIYILKKNIRLDAGGYTEEIASDTALVMP